MRGLQLKFERMKAGVRAKDLAKAAGLSSARVSQLESAESLSDADVERLRAGLRRCAPCDGSGDTLLERCAAAQSELTPKIAEWQSRLDEIKAGMLRLRADWEKHRPTRDWPSLEPHLTKWAELMVQFNAVVSEVDRSCQKAADLVVLQRLITEALVPTSAALSDIEDWPCAPKTSRCVPPRTRPDARHDEYAPPIRQALDAVKST